MELPQVLVDTSAPEMPPPPCVVCAICRVACAKTDDGLCWACSQEEERAMELGGEG